MINKKIVINENNIVENIIIAGNGFTILKKTIINFVNGVEIGYIYDPETGEFSKPEENE